MNFEKELNEIISIIKKSTLKKFFFSDPVSPDY